MSAQWGWISQVTWTRMNAIHRINFFVLARLGIYVNLNVPLVTYALFCLTTEVSSDLEVVKDGRCLQ